MNPSTHGKMNLEWTCPNSHSLEDTACLTQTALSKQNSATKRKHLLAQKVVLILTHTSY